MAWIKKKEPQSAEDKKGEQNMDNPFSVLSDGDDDDDDDAHRQTPEQDDEDSQPGIEVAAMLQIVASENVVPPKEEKTTFIEEGLEPPYFFTQKAYVFNEKFSQHAFYGRCFLCCYPGHSQRYCSLKYCAACDTYGHSALNCLSYPKIRIPLRASTPSRGTARTAALKK